MDLRDAQWILPRSNAPALALFETQFRRMKVKPPEPSVETADLAAIRGLPFDTDMIAALSAHHLQLDIQSGQLAILDVKLPNTRRDIGLTTCSTGSPSPAARALIDAIRLRYRRGAKIPKPMATRERDGGRFHVDQAVTRDGAMKNAHSLYYGYRFPPADITQPPGEYISGETERLAFPLENSLGNQRVIDQILAGSAATETSPVRQSS